MTCNYKHIFASKDKKFVQISEKFELTSFELSDEFYQDLMAHRTKKFVQISEGSNCWIFELMGIDCIDRTLENS